MLSAIMKMRLQSFASLLTRFVFVFLVLFAMLVSFTTKVFTQTVWEKHPDNPVLEVGPVGSWDHQSVIVPSVLIDGTTYHMWYGGDDGTHFRIGYATSPDGITWTKDTLNPVLDVGPAGSWEDYCVFFPTVLIVGSTFHMWYTGDDGTHYRFGHATSPDGLTWTKDTLNPVLDLGPAGSWDNASILAPFVRFDGAIYHMWYSGVDGIYWRIGYATSPDGIIWTKYDDPTTTTSPFAESDPVLDVGPAGSWDDYFVHAEVVFDTATSTYKMWYMGGVEAWHGNIGYATSDTTPIGIDDNISTDLPRSFVLSQNYPNPFNPSTRISYSIPTSGIITLKIYDILGREIQTLVSDIQKSGTYSINFDGSGLSSGIYFYRLQVGSDLIKTRKMLLIH